MATKKATIKIGADTKEAEKGLNKIASEINKFGNSGAVKGIKNISQAFTGVTGAMSTVIDAAQKVKAVMDSCAEAYRTQAKAEKQLEAAAKNNPYLTSTSVTALKNYASELQNISTVGDEQLLPMMAELAAAGRTQNEIQDIMSAALDVSASGMMSLEGAVSALNGTYSGTTGTLGKMVSGVKELTKEELAQGKAVQLVAENFKGMAKDVSDATGSYEKMKNLQGDFAEAVGKFIEPTKEKWNKMWADIYKMGIEKIAALEKAASKFGMKMGLKSWVDEANAVYAPDGERGKREAGTEFMAKEDLAILKEILETKQKSGKISHEESNALMNVNTELRRRNAIEKEEEKEAQKKAKQAQQDRQIEQAKTKEKSANERASEAYAQYDETVKKKQEEIEWRRQAGEVISQEAEAQEMATTKLQAWFTMLDKSEGAISGKKGKALEIMEDIKQNFSEVAASEDLAAALQEYEKQYEDFAKDVNKIFQDTLKPSEILSQQIDQMEQQWSDLTENSIMWEQKSVEERQRLEEEYTAAHAELCRQRTEAIAAEAKESVEKSKEANAEKLADLEDKVSKVQTFSSNFANAVNAWANVAMQFVEAEKQEELNKLEEEYEQGLITLEEYEERKKEIEREAAEQEYKIKLWQWGAQCVQAVADSASAIIKAYKDGGFLNGVLVAAASAAQMAAVFSNKPQPPSGFATGGIVGGTSYTGDKIQANVNSGEMILNAQQQKNLFDSINGNRLNGNGGFNGDIKIYNYAADSTNTETQVTQDDIKIMITKQVKKDMANGVYNTEMKQAETTANGVRYTA